MNENEIYEILSGRFENVNEKKSNTVKIFLSSTFADTHAERDYLIANIYPKLREYCKIKYGLEFQVYDMRWGISHETTINHLTTTVCINEIENCQKFSVGPNFIAFLSHRYGSRCIPSRIKAKEYDLLKNEALNLEKQEISFQYKTEHMIEISTENLLEFCYELDDNEIPPRYRLKPIDIIIPNYNENNPIHTKTWSKIEFTLGNLVRKIALICYNKGLLTETQRDEYFVSVTEQEILKGILEPNNVDSNVLYFQRDIEDLEEKIENNVNLAKRFVELDSTNKIDKSVKSLLDDLKNKKIPSRLPKSNIFKFNVKWDDKKGISFDTHSDYIENFARTFYEHVKLMIDRNQLDKIKFDPKYTELLPEVIDHARFCNETVKKFHGRKDILLEVQKYILDNHNRAPFIIHGESGCGKTAILAKVTSEILKFVPDPENYTVILRFLGTTPISSDIIKTINFLVIQLKKIFNIDSENTRVVSQKDAQNYLNDTLIEITSLHPNKKIVIVLDSIDQLNPIFYKLDWLLTSLPPNVKMIYSTLPYHFNLLGLCERLIEKNENFLQIKSLDSDLALEILTDWLEKIDRKLSNYQLDVLREMFKTAVLFPLYVKLVFDIVSKWPSFEIPKTDFMNCLNIDKAIQYIFKHFELKHGKILFSRLMVYMTSFKNGITENEIEDILSLDDDVLYSVFEFHAPPVRKLPIALWARIKLDLKDYLVEKEFDDTRVIYWYHRRFIEVANSYYTSKLNSESRQVVFKNVFDFFNETWKNTPKPYKYNEYLAKKFGVQNGESEAVRDTGIQPTIITEPNGKIRFNKRKLTELPPFIAQLSANLALTLSTDFIYFDYYFFIGLFNCISLNDIFENLQQLTQSSSYSLNEESKLARSELKILSLCLLQCGSIIKDNADLCAIHFLNRSLNFYQYLPHFTKFINEYDRESIKLHPFILTHQYLNAPTAELIFQLDKHVFPITHACIGGDNDRFIFTLSNKIHVFDLQTISDCGEIKIPKLNVNFFCVYMENFDKSDDTNISNIKGGCLLSSPYELFNLDFESNVKIQIKFVKPLKDFVLISQNIVAILFEDSIDLYDLTNGKVIKTLEYEQKIQHWCHSLRKGYIIELESLKSIYMAVCLDDIHVIKLTEIDIENIKVIPSNGLKVNSIVFNGAFGIVSQKLLILYDKNCLCRFDISELTMFLYSHGLRVDKILDILDDMMICLTQSNSLCILSGDEIFEVQGNFSEGCFVNEGKFIGIEEGRIEIFSFKKHDLKIQLFKLGTIEAHFEMITFLFRKDSMLLTTSMDSTLKIFSLNMIQAKSEAKIGFQYTIKQIEDMVDFDEEHLITLLSSSNTFHLWEKPTGKIKLTQTFDTDELILNLYSYDSKIIVVSQFNDEKYRIRLLDVKSTDGLLKSDEKLRHEFTNVESVKVIIDKSKSQFYFLVSETSKLNIFTLTDRIVLIKQIQLDLHEFIIDNTCITFSNQILIIFHSVFYLINCKTGDKTTVDLFQKNLVSHKIYLTPIRDSDNFILIDNFKSLTFVNITNNQTSSFKSSDYQFDSFKLNKNLILAKDSVNQVLVCYNLDLVNESKTFEPFFKIQLNKDTLIDHYGFSPKNDHVYLIENNRNLKFYDLKDSIEQTGELLLYAEVTSVLCTNDYISFSMQDKKIVSFLINDKTERTYEKLKKLRAEPNDDLKRKNDLIVNKFIDDLDNSSDEEEDDVIDNIEEENPSDSRKKIIKSMKEIDVKCVVKNEIDLQDLKIDWKIDFSNEIEQSNDLKSDPVDKLSTDKFKKDLIKNNKFSSQACNIQ